MKHQHWEVWGLQPHRFEELSAISLSELFFFFRCSATVEINCYLWLSRPRLLKYWRTKRDWLSEVERLGQSRLIRQTKCYFCFLCGWGVNVGGEAAGSLITSAISVVPANPPYYSTFLSGADLSSTPCFPLNAQHLRLQLFPMSYLIHRLCLCMFVYRCSQSRSQTFYMSATLMLNLKVNFEEHASHER